MTPNLSTCGACVNDSASNARSDTLLKDGKIRGVSLRRKGQVRQAFIQLREHSVISDRANGGGKCRTMKTVQKRYVSRAIKRRRRTLAEMGVLVTAIRSILDGEEHPITVRHRNLVLTIGGRLTGGGAIYDCEQ